MRMKNESSCDQDQENFTVHSIDPLTSPNPTQPSTADSTHRSMTVCRYLYAIFRFKTFCAYYDGLSASTEVQLGSTGLALKQRRGVVRGAHRVSPELAIEVNL